MLFFLCKYFDFIFYFLNLAPKRALRLSSVSRYKDRLSLICGHLDTSLLPDFFTIFLQFFVGFFFFM